MVNRKRPLSKTSCCLCGSQGLTVYAFPSAKYHDIYEKWIEVLCEHNVSTSSSPEEVRRSLGVCERHFKDDDFCFAFKKDKTKKKLLKHNSVPFLNNDPINASVNDRITNCETDHHESETITDTSTTGALDFGNDVENICIPVSCTDYFPKQKIRDADKLYKLSLRQREIIAKQRKTIRNLESRIKILEGELRTEDDLNNEFVVHQRQKKRKPNGRRYTEEMKMLGVQMLEQGTANYERWRKLFVMPCRRTLTREAKKKISLQTTTNERLLENPQTTAVSDTSGNECLSKPLPELTSTSQD